MKAEHNTKSSLSPHWRALAARPFLSLGASLGLLLGVTASLQAQTTNLYIGSNTVWGASAAWSPANIPNAVDSMAIFNNTTNSINNPSSSSTYTLGTLNLTATTATIGFAGANLVLNFQTSVGTPVINCSGGAGLYWYFTTTGTQGFTKLGPGILTGRFSGVVNSGLTGPIIIGQGKIELNQAGSLGNASSITISNASSGLSLNNSAGTPTTGFGNVYTIMPAFQTVHLEGGGTPAIGSAVAGQTLAILGNVQTASGSALRFVGPGEAILAGTNNFVGTSTVAGGTLFLSTTTTNNGTIIVNANSTNAVIATSPGSSLLVSNLTLVGTNNSVLSFAPGLAGLPTVPLLNISSNLTFVTNVPAPIVLSGGNWQTGTAIPLLKYGTLVNTNAAGVFGSFALGALPQGFTAALSDGTSSNQVNLNVSSIVPLVWAPPTSGSNNWTTNTGVWSLGGTGGYTYKEVNLLGSSVQFDDSLTPVGPNIVVTNNSILSPNNVVFNNSTHNYTLLGSGGIANYAGITKSGTGYLTNSLANTYFGNTILNGGVMVLNNAAALGYGSSISFNGGTLQFSANNKIDYSGQFSAAANQRYSLNLGAQSITLSNALTSSGGSLTVSGPGTLALNAASSYTGATTNKAATLKLGIANALPVSTALTLGSSGTAATLDLAGFSQQVAGLALDPAATGATITNSSRVNPVTLQFNGGTSTFGGSIVDGTATGAKALALSVGGGSLTLTGVNTYTGNTTITNNGALVLGSSIASSNIIVGGGSLLDLSGITYVLPAAGSLSGVGTVNGGIEVASLAQLAAGYAGIHGTLTFSNVASAVTLDTGATVALNVATTPGSASNDKLTVAGQLNANDNNLFITALSGATALNTTTDYTLISSPNNAITGSFNSVPTWVGTKPVNYANFQIVTSPNAVTLHYSPGVLLSGVGSASPATGLHQSYVFSVQVTPGTGSTGIGVTADFSAIGGAVQTFAGVGNSFSYTNSVAGSIAPGTHTIPFTVTDAQADTYTGNIYVAVVNGALVWNGAAGDNNWDSLNWLNGAVPDASGDAGDAIIFAGSTRLAPVLDNSFNVTAVTFSNNASAFNITTPGNILTLAAGGKVENDSAATESLDVPINLTSGSIFNTPAGNLIVGALAASSDGFTKSGSGKLIIDGAAATSSYAGSTTLAGGTLAITNADSVLPPGTTIAYTAPATLDLGGQNQSVFNLNLSALAAGTATVTNGNLTVTTGGLNLSPNTTATTATILDLSGLSTFNFAAGNITFYGAIGANSTVKLAQTNNITGNNILIANGGLTAVATGATAALLLGQSNVFDVGNIQLGGYHNAAGTIAFNPGLINPTLVLRGIGGTGSAVGTLNLGVNNNGSPPAFSIDTTAGSLDAVVNSLYVVNNNSSGGTGTLSVSNAILNVGTIYMSYDNGSTVSTTANAIINQNGGTVLVANLGLNYNTSTGNPGVTSTYNLGKGATGAGLLSAYNINIGATQAITNSSRATLNFNNGTIENYDPALGQSDAVGVVAGAFGSQQNLVISGLTGGGTTNDNLTLNIVLAPTGTHNFYAESGYTITEDPTVLITGSGGLTANGPGLVILNGTNTYTGNTTISAGTLELAQPTLFWRSTVTVSNAAVLQLDFAGTDQVAALTINGTSKAPGVYSAATDPGYIAGPGSITVVPLKTNAFLTSLALNPADSLNPGFATNLFAYSATNAFGTNLTVTVINGDLTASNRLFLNGLAIQTLTSSVPSLTLTNFGVGATNVIKVLVTAQDGVTTNLYTVNLTELPAIIVNTNPATAYFTATAAGSTLSFNWAPDHKGWQLYTNATSLTATNQWFPLTGSVSTTNETITINPAQPNVFFQLRYP